MLGLATTMPACQKDSNVSGFADRCMELEALALAPCDLEPLGPMLASTPALAIGDSEATYASAALDCPNAPTARPTRVARRVKRMVPCGQTGVGEEGRRRPRTSNETLQDQGTSSAIFIPLSDTATERMPAVAMMTKLVADDAPGPRGQADMLHMEGWPWDCVRRARMVAWLGEAAKR